jgi:hypothetical protein
MKITFSRPHLREPAAEKRDDSRRKRRPRRQQIAEHIVFEAMELGLGHRGYVAACSFSCG